MSSLFIDLFAELLRCEIRFLLAFCSWHKCEGCQVHQSSPKLKYWFIMYGMPLWTTLYSSVERKVGSHKGCGGPGQAPPPPRPFQRSVPVGPAAISTQDTPSCC